MPELRANNQMDSLALLRDTYTDKTTIGKLILNGEEICDTLEDTVRNGPKILGKTAIPSGHYKVVVTYSNRFKTALPLLLDVPGFEGIRIHAGNTDADTEGCILVGIRSDKTPNFIGNSRFTLTNIVYPKILAAVQRGPVYIDVRNQ